MNSYFYFRVMRALKIWKLSLIDQRKVKCDKKQLRASIRAFNENRYMGLKRRSENVHKVERDDFKNKRVDTARL